MGLGGMGGRARTCGRTLKGANYQPGAMTGMWAQGYVGAHVNPAFYCLSRQITGDRLTFTDFALVQIAVSKAFTGR